MSAVNTDEGTILEVLNSKSDRDLRNVNVIAKADAVIDYQIPTAENSYTWYRLYSDGWVEQGGVVASIPSSKYQDVVFPVIMANTHYTPMITGSWSGDATGQNEGAQNTTTTGMRVTASYATVGGLVASQWYGSI